MNPQGAGSEAECVREARASVREAARLLTRPGGLALEAGLPHLENAARRLRSLEVRPAREAGRRPGLVLEVEELRKDVRRLTILMDHAAALYLAHARILYAGTDGYSASGDPVPPAAARTVSIRG
jgi:hypothetical protein